MGTAYGFFYCEAHKEAIEREIPALKKAGALHDLEVKIITDFDEIRQDIRKKFIEKGEHYYFDEDPTGIEAIFESASENNLDYVLSGYLMKGTNLEAARQVSHLLMQMNQSYLNKLGEVWGNVIYKEDNGVFVFL